MVDTTQISSTVGRCLGCWPPLGGQTMGPMEKMYMTFAMTLEMT